MQYVLGFAFNEPMTDVLLIRKNRPEWQKGRFNGIGGKIEDDESPIHAMEREFDEEVYNTSIDKIVWKYVCTMQQHSEWTVWVYACVLEDGAFRGAKAKTDEKILSFNHRFCTEPTVFIENLKWLIPLSQAMLKNEIDYNATIN